MTSSDANAQPRGLRCLHCGARNIKEEQAFRYPNSDRIAHTAKRGRFVSSRECGGQVVLDA